VLLAAGRGSRLKELTDELPKCLMELAGKSLLSWQLAALGAAGLNDLVVVRGYGKEHLNGNEYEVIDNPRWSESNMVSTLRCANERLLEGAVVSYSDIVYHPRIVEQLLASEADISITYDRLWLELWTERFEDPLEDAETFIAEGNRVTELGNRAGNVDQIEGQFMGLIKFSPKGWEQTERFLSELPASEVDRLDMTGLLGMLIKSGIQIGAVPVDGRWCEADTQSDLKLYEHRISEHDALGTTWTHDWRW
jgi:L-glutamine-phosphate cytidylyltransferase